jgi:hypothetical protein
MSVESEYGVGLPSNLHSSVITPDRGPERSRYLSHLVLSIAITKSEEWSLVGPAMGQHGYHRFVLSD